MAIGSLVALGAGLFKGVSTVVKGIQSIRNKAKPVVKVAASVAAGMGMAKITSGGSSVNLPVQTGSLPPIGVPAAAVNKQIQQSGPGGLPVPFWKGPGGKLQMPWNDPKIPEYLKQFALDDAYLRTYYRAPKGYVIIRDASGRPFAVNKQMARSFGLWRPAKKPPISVGDWQKFKAAERVEKKLRKIAGPALRKRGGTTRTVSTSKRKGR